MCTSIQFYRHFLNVSDTRRRTNRISAVICGVTFPALVEQAFFLFVLLLLFSSCCYKIIPTVFENDEQKRKVKTQKPQKFARKCGENALKIFHCIKSHTQQKNKPHTSLPPSCAFFRYPKRRLFCTSGSSSYTKRRAFLRETARGTGKEERSSKANQNFTKKRI